MHRDAVDGRAGASGPDRDDQSGLSELLDGTTLTPLVGRDREVSEIVPLLRNAESGVVLLYGVAGVGKSRVAHAVGKALAVEPVVIDGSADTDSLATAVTWANGLRAGRRPAQGLRLVLLDNFENVDLAFRARVVAALDGLDGVRIVVTDRRYSPVDGGQAYAITPLAVPNDYSLLDLDGFARIPSVQLYATVVRQRQPDFRLHEGNQRLVAKICTDLQGIPAHVQMAAQMVWLDGPDVLAPDTDLGMGADTAADFVRFTEHTENAWRSESLGEQERLVLGCASSFSGGFSTEAIGVVTEQPDLVVRQALDRLVEQNLVTLSATPSGCLDKLAGARFHLPITAFPVAKAAAGSDHDLRSAHANYYARLAHSAVVRMHGREQALGVATLNSETRNISAALAFLTTELQLTSAFELMRDLKSYWQVTGRLFELRHRLEGLLVAEAEMSADTRAQSSLLMAEACARLGEAEAAEDCLDRAARSRSDQSDPNWLADELNVRGIAKLAAHDASGLELLQEAAVRYQRAANEWAVARTTQEIAFGKFCHGKTEEAADVMRSALSNAVRRGDRMSAGAALLRLCVFSARMRDERAACAYFERAMGQLRSLGTAVVVGALVELMETPLLPGPIEKATYVTLLLGCCYAHERPTLTNLPEPEFLLADLAERMRPALDQKTFHAALHRGEETPLRALVMEFGQRAFGDVAGTGPAEAMTDLIPVQRTESSVESHDSAYDEVGLTPRQRQVATQVASGASNRQIAHRLAISEWTVINHLRQIMRKLDCSSRVHVASWVNSHTAS